MTKGATLKRLPAAIAGLAIMAASAATAETVAPDSVPIEDMELKVSLTGTPGDATVGRETFADRKKGNCLACHANEDLKDQLFHGEVGPELNGVADRWTEEQLRAIVVNSKAVFGDQSIMPGFYTMKVGVNVAEKHQGKTILSAQDVEDVVAYLMTLKEN
ncbi:sulfur oxidation c-type cytochrome SoxX [Labrenzia sp. R4_1]|jgi:sulfur-oxidizing protein SoxX|uniref:sulfur oxidation c-type cytochrome SoxX n=1 Tax=Labrenzia sp. R4_1 TaxID=2821106 RepID=UPI0010644C5D|nr:sulfur oxidation c-type cytochrome SoxX [Labrenzia sp. R4_1]MBO9425920.1 sulfur oxidation c-type cytochrome SoxX [Labrenzia sp. R4_1]